MNPGVLLIVCLLSLYLLATMILWHCHRGQKTEATLIAELMTEVPFALQVGQTILGVMDTTKLTCFCIGNIEEHVHDEEDTRQ
jgi:hypothetical protein